MMKIFKYALEITDEQHVELPHDSQLLSVQDQNGQLTLWALINPNLNMVFRLVTIIGTGHPITKPRAVLGTFIGTVQMYNGLVWHVFVK